MFSMLSTTLSLCIYLLSKSSITLYPYFGYEGITCSANMLCCAPRNKLLGTIVIFHQVSGLYDIWFPYYSWVYPLCCRQRFDYLKHVRNLSEDVWDNTDAESVASEDSMEVSLGGDNVALQRPGKYYKNQVTRDVFNCVTYACMIYYGVRIY